MMPGMDGLELHRHIRGVNPKTPVIMITGYATVRTALQAVRQGVFDYIAKPFTRAELQGVVGAGGHLHGSYAIAEDGTPLTGIMEVPKDRTQLANMRVIRRNLVYAVGLPPAIANEDVLRRPEYFGQYGRIAKIVLNRSQATNGDPRRASCSAYVTFAHKVRLHCLLQMLPCTP